MLQGMRYAVFLACLSLGTGCHVGRVTDRWSDFVDRTADYEPDFEHLYRSDWDLTREYRPDGGDHWLFLRNRCDGRDCP